MRVTTRDGTEEDFAREKIVAAVLKAGDRVNSARLDEARSIAQEVESSLSASSRVTTEQIRTEVLSRLKDRNAAVYKSWISYDKQHKKKA
jgi:transcriptional regulator NrdR family protein